MDASDDGAHHESADVIHERLRSKCEQKFGTDVSATFDLNDCYYLLVTVLKLEMSGVSACHFTNAASTSSTPGYSTIDSAELLPPPSPDVRHNADFHSACGQVERRITAYAMPILQLLCLFGNALNLLVYRLPYFHGSSAVHFLRAKALANLVFVQSRTLEVLHAWAWTLDASGVERRLEPVYWRTRPYIITVANISGTVSTWMTLFITIETVLCVLRPFSFRKYCTRRTTLWLLGGCLVASVALHLIFLCTHEVNGKLALTEEPIVMDERNVSSSTSLPLSRTCWKMTLTYSMQPVEVLQRYRHYEKLYYWLQMMASIVLPTLAMLVCSLLIVTRFTFKELGEAFSQRRKCVIRLTVATTLSHLLLEGPALLTFGAVASRGAFVQSHNAQICIINHANNLLSVINATIPFFVFLACNQQFREMSAFYLLRLGCLCGLTDYPSPGAVLTATGNGSVSGSRRRRRIAAKFNGGGATASVSSSMSQPSATTSAPPPPPSATLLDSSFDGGRSSSRLTAKKSASDSAALTVSSSPRWWPSTTAIGPLSANNCCCGSVSSKSLLLGGAGATTSSITTPQHQAQQLRRSSCYYCNTSPSASFLSRVDGSSTQKSGTDGSLPRASTAPMTTPPSLGFAFSAMLTPSATAAGEKPRNESLNERRYLLEVER